MADEHQPFNVTRIYHREAPGHPRGSSAFETVCFHGALNAVAYAIQFNEDHQSLPFHIVCVERIGGGEFHLFSVKKIWDAAGPEFVADFRRVNCAGLLSSNF